MPTLPARGVIFDLDGTLVDSGLDFARMRSELGIPPGVPILEALADMADEDAAACFEKLHEHEEQGVQRATPMPHVEKFLAALTGRSVLQAVLTRNRRAIARQTLERLAMLMDPVLGREDAPAKPDPAAIHRICEIWGLTVDEVVVIGDYHFDIDAGRNAGARTVLYARGRDPAKLRWAARADYILPCFSQHECLLAWLEGGDGGR